MNMKKTILVFSLSALAVFLGSSNFTEKSIIRQEQKYTVYSVLIHSPGTKWVDSLSFREQPGIEMHVNYMATLLESKKLVMGGPFLDNSGGMVIYNGSTEEAEKDANNDPAVKEGLLNVKVKSWMVVMSRE
jgi:uncharacterized protein YciI